MLIRAVDEMEARDKIIGRDTTHRDTLADVRRLLPK
jgi:hypothetical protein